MQVLVGVDGSSHSFAAVEFIGRLLSLDRDQLELLFAAPTLSFTPDDELAPEVEQRARAVLSRAVLDAACDRLPAAWRHRAKQREVAGPADRALLDAVREYGADLVVVGFRGTSSLWEEFVLGSVSRSIVQSSPVPVLVVKSSAQASRAGTSEAAAEGDRFRLLVAHDGSSAAEQIAQVLHRFSWPAATAGITIRVVRPMFPYDLPDWVKDHPRDPDVEAMAAAWEQEHRQNVAAARQELERFGDQLPAAFAGQETLVVEGRPAEQIVAVARERGTDMIVVASRGRGRIEQLLIGSTAEQVLASAMCSVLIAR